MLGLRKFMRVCYGYLAGIFVLASLSTVPGMLMMYRQNQLRAADLQRLEPWQAFVDRVVPLVMAIPIPLAIFFGIAWWTLRQGRPSARVWALIASTLAILLSAPLLFLLGAYLWYHTAHIPFIVDLVSLGLPAVGIAGLVAFWRNTNSANTSAARPALKRIAGDGTSRPLDMLAFAVGVGSALIGFNWYMRWGYRHGLERANFMNWWLLFFAAALIATAAHELGHASIGIAVGMKVRMFQVGPFRWRIRDGRWRFDFVLAQIFKFGGATAVVPLNPRQERWRDILMLAAGPAGSLFIGLVALGMMVTAPNSAYERYWEVFALIALFGLCSVLFNLVPQRPEALYTDGARIYQLLSGGPWSDLHRINASVLATTVTPLRSRDLDIEQIHRAEADFAGSAPGISLKLIASSYYMDTRDFATADRYVAEAEAIYHEQGLLKHITPEMCILLTYRVAVLRRDATAARAWWERAMAQKIAHKGFDYWLAKSALAWIEGRLDDADQDWQQAGQRANQLGQSGDAEFDRDRLHDLRKLLDASRSTAAPTHSGLTPATT